jgi:hypothetical protein
MRPAPPSVARVLDGVLAADPGREALATRSGRLTYADPGRPPGRPGRPALRVEADGPLDEEAVRQHCLAERARYKTLDRFVAVGTSRATPGARSSGPSFLV